MNLIQRLGLLECVLQRIREAWLQAALQETGVDAARHDLTKT